MCGSFESAHLIPITACFRLALEQNRGQSRPLQITLCSCFISMSSGENPHKINKIKPIIEL